IDSHLNWLATFAKTLGSEWMHRQAARWHRIIQTEQAELSGLPAFLDQIRNMPYLQMKLSVGEIIPDQLLHPLSGPTAKAVDKAEDARSKDGQYQSLGWEPVVKQENSAWRRLLVRLEEIEQSLELVQNTNEQQTEMEE